MNPQLLELYERQLARLRQDGREIARVSADGGTLGRLYDEGDPFVVQLIQAFAYSLARMELKLKSERDRVPGAVLQTLYPAALRPVPARTVVQFELPEQGDVAAQGRHVPAGTAMTAPGSGGDAVFRTTCDCVVPSVRVEDPQVLPPGDADRARHRLRLTLRSPRPQMPLSAVGLPLPAGTEVRSLRRDPRDAHGLRLFLGGPDLASAMRLYQALTRAPVGAVLGGRQAAAARLEDCVRPVGFDVAESLLPVDPRQSEAARLLTEYAVFREKYLFVDVVGLTPDLFRGLDQHATLDLLLEPESAALLAGRSLAQVIRLGCVPVVNLQPADLDGRPLHRARGEFALDGGTSPFVESTPREIFAVERVHASYQGNTEVEYLELFAPTPPGMSGAARPTARGEGRRWHGGYWYARRVPTDDAAAAAAAADPEAADDGDFAAGVDADPAAAGDRPRWEDVRLSLVEFDPKRLEQAGRTLHVTALTFLRRLIGLRGAQLVLGGDHGTARSVTSVLEPVWPVKDGDVAVKLVELLSCGAGLLRGGRDAAASLGDLLALYARMYPESGVPSHLLRHGLVQGVEFRTIAQGLAGGVARGLEVKLRVSPRGSSPHEVYLLARVLDHALSAFCTAGNFISLRVFSEDRQNVEELAKCPPRLGKIALI